MNAPTFMRARIRFVATLATLMLLLSPPLAAAPTAELWERWTAHDPASTSTIYHGAWTQFLRTYVTPSDDRVSRIDYGNVAAEDRRSLEAYVERLTETPISGFNRVEQRAFWINLYNALTVKVVLDQYPVESILDISISPGWFSFGPWDKKLITVEGEELSLNDIEHRILRPIWRDPRIHYAVNCASYGCPNLREVAFTPDNTEPLLEQAAREYVNHPRAAAFIGGKLIVSSIYHWFKEDFGDSDRGVIEHLKIYADSELAASLATTGRLGGHDYDWALNDTARER